MRCPISLVGAFLSLLILTSAAQTAGGQEGGRVTGVVVDIAGRTVEDAKVEFFKDGKAFITRPDKDGKYEIELAAGTYRVRVESNTHYTVPRAPFSLLRGSSVRFDFELMRRFIIRDYTYNGPAEFPPPKLPADPGTYEEEELGPIAPDGLRSLVRYGERHEQGDEVRYSTLLHDAKQFPVVYTYDLLTIKANTLTYSKKDNSVHGAGDVVYQDGENTRHGSSIDLTFRDAEPHVDLAN